MYYSDKDMIHAFDYTRRWYKKEYIYAITTILPSYLSVYYTFLHLYKNDFRIFIALTDPNGKASVSEFAG